MGKKSLENKIARKFIVDSRNNGITDQEIYHELSQQYFDKHEIALLITGTVKPENKSRYKIYNNVLLGLSGFFILFKLFITTNLIIQNEGQLSTHLLVLTFVLLFAGIMFMVAKYDGQSYRVGGILAISFFCQIIAHSANGIDILISTSIASIIAGLLFFLDKKLFPDYHPRKMKQDSNGEYILG